MSNHRSNGSRSARATLRTLLSLCLCALPAATQPPVPDTVELPNWTRLEFKASKLFVTAHSALEVELIPSSQAAPDWVAIEPAHSPPSHVVRIRSTARFLGRTSATDVWLAPGDLRAFQRHAIDSGSRQRHKIYRFGERQILALRSEPDNKDEAALPEPDWTRRGEQRLEIGSESLVTDPVAVFYLLSQLPTTEQVLHVVTNNEVGAVRIALAERGPVSSQAVVVFEDGKEIQPVGDRAGLRYTVTPADPSSDFSLLGLEGAISVWIDEEFGVPIEVRGKISPVGTVRVRLERAVLRGGHAGGDRRR